MSLSRIIYSIAAASIAIACLAPLGCSGDTTIASSGSASSGAGGSGSGSSSSGDSGSGGAPYTYEQYCQDTYDRDVKCMNMPTPTQVAECVSKEPCDDDFFRDGVITPIHQCEAMRDCMTSDDSCVAAASASQPDSASSLAYSKACFDKLIACQKAGTPFADDSCYNVNLVKDPVLDQMIPCFDQACDMVLGCVFDIIGKVYEPCGGMH